MLLDLGLGTAAAAAFLFRSKDGELEAAISLFVTERQSTTNAAAAAAGFALLAAAAAAAAASYGRTGEGRREGTADEKRVRRLRAG